MQHNKQTMLWSDTERPKTLDDCACHPHITNKFKALASRKDIPHLLVHGPKGSGKTTRINALLYSLFGREVTRVDEYEKTFRVGSSEKSVMVPESLYHTILIPSTLHVSDRYLVQHIIKSQAEVEVERHSYRVIVIYEADKLSHTAQHALRRLMEQYIDACRLILVAHTTSSIIEPLQSRLVSIRVPHPTHTEVRRVVDELTSKKKIVSVPTIDTRNLFKVHLQLQLFHVTGSVEHDGSWQDAVQEIVAKCMKKSSPDTIATFRNDWVAIFGWGVTTSEAIEELYHQGKNYIPDEKTDEWLDFCTRAELDSIRGSQPLYHLEHVIMKLNVIHNK